MDKFISFLIEHYYYSLPILVAFILLIRSNATKGGKKISVQELISLNNQDKVQLIDLRPSGEFNDGHIVGSVNIPFADIQNRSHEIKKVDDKFLILICETGGQSANAGETLKKLGFDNNLILSGGIRQWRMDNLPLV